MITAPPLTGNPFCDDVHCRGLFAALLADPLPSPESDHIRLLIADRLEEIGVNGGQDWSERAEFIRVQVELANLKCESCDGTGYHRYKDMSDGTPNYSDSAPCGYCKGSGWSDPKRGKALRNRGRDLLQANYQSWYPEIPKSFQFVVEPYTKTTQPTCMFARGFPSSVQIAWLDDLMGRACERCGGDGKAHGSDRPFEWPPDQNYMKCPACRGTGHVGGIGIPLFQSAPITQVTVGDKRPHMIERAAFWWESTRRHNPEHRLPVKIYNALPCREFHLSMFSDPESAANLVLSAAIVGYFREAAGLEPLPKKEAETWSSK